MIAIHIPEGELFDERTETFLYIPETNLTMEHSLISIRKWEGAWKIPFLSSEKNSEQLLDYLRIMTLTKNVNPIVYHGIPQSEMKRIGEYIKDKKTAMTISNSLVGAQKHSNELVTAETIYWWMITLGIPWEFEKWHLEQLLALIKFISIKNDPKKQKMSQKDLIRRNAEINARNRKKYHTKG